jgi:3-oxoacid CoA-transferase subunit A
MDKVCADINSALKDLLFNGMSIMAGGFGLCGIPENAISYIHDSGIKNLTLISNNPGVDDFGLGLLCKNKQVKKLIVSFLGANKSVEEALIRKEIEVELVPQGTLAARIRAAGAGIPAFYTPTGYGTVVMEGKEVRYFDDKPYIMERALFADLAIVRGYKADKYGNTVYRKAASNFNPVMATAAHQVVAEVEHIAVPGELEKDRIHTPGIFVDRVVQGTFEKRIEQRMTREA